mmetsp:Transcript_52352/g.146024  ORF Transcript_52352/g.146024 Transcript_52352/m.146024 type:complete len:432 (+) Transcript_52352:2247-3542(+)
MLGCRRVRELDPLQLNLPVHLRKRYALLTKRVDGGDAVDDLKDLGRRLARNLQLAEWLAGHPKALAHHHDTKDGDDDVGAGPLAAVVRVIVRQVRPRRVVCIGHVIIEALLAAEAECRQARPVEGDVAGKRARHDERRAAGRAAVAGVRDPCAIAAVVVVPHRVGHHQRELRLFNLIGELEGAEDDRDDHHHKVSREREASEHHEHHGGEHGDLPDAVQRGGVPLFVLPLDAERGDRAHREKALGCGTARVGVRVRDELRAVLDKVHHCHPGARQEGHCGDGDAGHGRMSVLGEEGQDHRVKSVAQPHENHRQALEALRHLDHRLRESGRELLGVAGVVPADVLPQHRLEVRRLVPVHLPCRHRINPPSRDPNSQPHACAEADHYVQHLEHDIVGDQYGAAIARAELLEDRREDDKHNGLRDAAPGRADEG